MDSLRRGVFVLTVLPAAVSCSELLLSHTVICYFLDAFLLIYCITFTIFFFREKYLNNPVTPQSDDDDGTYQELERPKDTDPYQALEPTKKKKKAAKKNKPEVIQRDQGLARPLPGGGSTSAAQ